VAVFCSDGKRSSLPHGAWLNPCRARFFLNAKNSSVSQKNQRYMPSMEQHCIVCVSRKMPGLDGIKYFRHVGIPIRHGIFVSFFSSDFHPEFMVEFLLKMTINTV
jgi:hypothetical protein